MESFSLLQADDYATGYLFEKELFFYERHYEKYPNPLYPNKTVHYSCAHYEKIKKHKFCPECGKLVARHEMSETPEFFWSEVKRVRKSFGENACPDEMVHKCIATVHGYRFRIIPLISVKGGEFATVGAYNGAYEYYDETKVTHILVVADDTRFFTEWNDKDFQKVMIKIKN